MNDELLTPQELADRLKMPLATVYRWNSVGGGPAFMKIGKHVRYAESAVDAWLSDLAARSVRNGE